MLPGNLRVTSLAGRSIVFAAVAVAAFVVVTQVPLVPTGDAGLPDARAVPVDTWLAGRFPAARDFYREHLAPLSQPRRLPLLAFYVAALVAVAASFPRPLGAWIASCVPPTSASALGAFRLAFGLAMFLALLRVTPADPIPFDAQRASSWLARQDLIRELAATEAGSSWSRWGALLGLVLFTVGAWPRVALIVAVSSLTLFIGIELNQTGMHDWGIPLISLWALVFVDWGDSGGLQGVLARWRGLAPRPVSASARGLALWLPALTLSMALGAAAYAKLDTSGLAWITGGAVRFHFLQDAHQAPVQWGLRVAGSDGAAVGLSLAAVATEGLFWLVTLTPNLGIRLAFGLAGMAMLTGFYLFQGVLWPAWWALFLVFLPWPLIGRSAVAPAAGTSQTAGPLATSAIPVLASVVIVAIALQQPIVSALRVESEPFFSDYSMYSHTWPSKRAFNEQFGEKVVYELAAEGRSSDVLRQWLRETPVFLDAMNAATSRSIRGETWPDATRSAINAARRAYQIEFGEPLLLVDVRQLVRGFDWERGAFDTVPRVTTAGVLDLGTGRFAPRETATELAR